MVSSDRFSKQVVLPTALPALVVALVLLVQWRSTACTFEEAGPGLYVCRQRLLGWELQTALIRVATREGGWLLWGRRQV